MVEPGFCTELGSLRLEPHGARPKHWTERFVGYAFNFTNFHEHHDPKDTVLLNVAEVELGPLLRLCLLLRRNKKGIVDFHRTH